MDVDQPLPRSAYQEDYGGAGRGMIADREPPRRDAQQEIPPRGPRRVHNPAPAPLPVPPASTPNPSTYPPRQRTTSHTGFTGGRPEDRQPPPHMVMRQSWNDPSRRNADVGAQDTGPPPTRYERPDTNRVDEREQYHEPRFPVRLDFSIAIHVADVCCRTKWMGAYDVLRRLPARRPSYRAPTVCR